MSFTLSNRSDIETFRALDNLRNVNEKVAQGEDIIRLEAGQPCFGAPQAVIDYTRDTLVQDPTQGYTDALGMASLRERIAQYYQDTYGITFDSSRVAITVGSSSGFILAFLSAFDAGDKVAVCTPTYAAYINILTALDIEVVEIQTGPETNFQPSLDLIKNCGSDFKGIIINSPSNPTGTIIDDSEMQSIIDWCVERGIRVVSDEAYHQITYDRDAKTALSCSDQVIVMNTFSKYFAMTGWRLGWVIMPEDMKDRMKRLAESLFVSPPTISQHAAYKIFDHLDTLNEYVEHYKKNRDILMEGLPKAGLTKLSKCEGAFYIFADVSEYTNDSEAFCKQILEEAKVSVTSGLDFDPTRGRNFMRMSYAGEPQDMQEALKRLGAWLEKFQGDDQSEKMRASA